ncbi:MAG: hypothetical protein F6K08_16870 [Okeania sp. SIO1H6]|nr:hypothetical protein [Okeania sp. SIO1H6]
MEDYISANFNDYTINKIQQAVAFTLGGSDWLTRKQLFEGLKFSDISVSTSQLYKDIELLRECSHVSGFNYFKGDRGFDKSTVVIIVAFRWLARNRSRGQAIIHLSEVIKLLEVKKTDANRQYCNHTTVEVKAKPVTI